ncbi:branched-chain amino acid ABC transporter ATP-binding protein/permease [Nonomuraea sp. NPDC003707]
MLTPLARGRTRPVTLALVGVLAVTGALPIDQPLEFLLATAMAWAVAAIGLDMFSGYLGQPSFGHCAFVGLGAYAYAILAGAAEVTPMVAALCAVALVTVISAVIGLALIRLRTFGLVLGTFFLSYAVTSALSGTTFASITQASSGLQVPELSLASANLSQGRGYYYLCTIVLFAAVMLSSNYSDSHAGRALRLVKRSEVVSVTVGVSPGRTRLTAFAYSAALAGASGVLLALGAGYIAPENFGSQQSIILFGMAAVGGLGSIAGPILGAVAFTLTPNYLQLAKTYQEVLFAALLLAALVFFRNGLFGVLEAPVRAIGQQLGFRGSGQADSEPREMPADLESVVETGVPGEAVQVKDLVVDYGGVRALDGVSFTISPGHVHALVGPNGAGKTTLLNCVSGLEPASTGSVTIQGERVTTSAGARRPRVSRTFQNPSLVPDLSCLENVMLGLRRDHGTRLFGDLTGLHHRAERETRRKASAVLGFVGIPSHRHDVPASELSLAEAKLVDIARAVAFSGAVLVMDEPTAGLSSAEMATVSALIGKLRARLTVLVVSHHVGWVKEVAQEVTVLAAGKVIASGSPEEVFGRPIVREVFVGDGSSSSEVGLSGTAS